jgi:hypothetical protein
MGEWLSYSLTDFLMFDRETYFRLLGLYNTEVWPAQPIAAATALVLLVLTRRPNEISGRLAPAILAVAWAFVARAFFLGHYADINLAAPYFAGGFAAQALLMAGFAVLGHLRFAWSGGSGGRAGLVLTLFAVLIFPVIELLSGRPLTGIQLFGLSPDPTAVGTLGLLLMTPQPIRWLLAPLPLLWCAISGLTYLAMEVPIGLVTPAVALIAVALMLRGSRPPPTQV